MLFKHESLSIRLDPIKVKLMVEPTEKPEKQMIHIIRNATYLVPMTRSTSGARQMPRIKSKHCFSPDYVLSVSPTISCLYPGILSTEYRLSKRNNTVKLIAITDTFPGELTSRGIHQNEQIYLYPCRRLRCFSDD